MTCDLRLPGVVVAALLLLVSCGAGEAPAAPTHAPAALVEKPVKESGLTTITLTPQAEERLGIVTVAVERRSMPRARCLGGEVIAAPGGETVMMAPFAGTLDAPNGIPVVGTTVAPGRVLFRLIPLAPSERNARVDAQRAAAESTARQEAAALRHRRAVELERDGAGSRRAVEEASADLKVADADLEAARDRLALEDRGSRSGNGVALEAPYRALVRGVHAAPGQVVAAAAPLCDLVRLDQVWVRVPIYVGDLDDIDPDAAATVVGLGEPAEAEGVSASPVPESLSADSKTAGITLYYALDNAANALRPGQRVGVRLRRKGEAESLVVPRASLLYDAYGGTWVYEAHEAHVFVRRRVSVADLVGADALLERGPEPGTRVVTDGAAELFGTEFGAGK